MTAASPTRIVLLVMLAALPGWSQPAIPPEQAVMQPESTQRSIPVPSVPLGSLTPTRPAEYLRAGEDLALDPNQQLLARATLALAVLLNAQADPATAASAAIALASLARNPDEHRGLWAMAVSLDPTRAAEWRWFGRHNVPADPLRSAAASALALLRHNHPDATAAMTDPVRDRVLDEALRTGHPANQVQAILSKWLRDAANDACRGRLTERSRSGDTVLTVSCSTPDCHHGTRVDAEWAVMVGLELSLTGSAPSSWSTQAALGLDAPLPVWSLDRLGSAFEVSANRPVYRSGRWTAP